MASCVPIYKTQIKNILISRHLLQLHHDDGGEQRGVDGGGAQLPPQDRGDPRDADVGECHLILNTNFSQIPL